LPAMLSAALAPMMPVAHRIVDTQQQLQQLKAQLQASQAAQLASITAAAAAAAQQQEKVAAKEDEEAAAEEEEDASSDAPRRSASSRAHVVAPLSALAVPASLSPEVPRLLSALQADLSLLRGRLEALSPAGRAACFDAMFAGPIFAVLVAHPKAAERGSPGGGGAQAGNEATTLRSAPFPMLPHQDRVWEEALKCLGILLEGAASAPPALLASGAFPRRFFLVFQLLLHFLPSDFATASSQGGTKSRAGSETATGAGAAAVWHSEETRLQALHCTTQLFRCVSSLLSPGSACAPQQLAPLHQTLQRDPGFVVSLGYYIHLLLRFANKERNRTLRMGAVEALTVLVELLQLPALNEPTTTTAAGASVPGRMLLLSYFPGLMSALFQLLLFDVASSGAGPSGQSNNRARAAGWRLRHKAFTLFVAITRAAVGQVARVGDIVQRALQAKDAPPTTGQGQGEEPAAAQDANTAAADATLRKLQALVPKPSASAASPRSPTSASSASFSPAGLHPVLQQILRPIDWSWWSEAEGHISGIMERVFSASGGGAALAGSNPLVAGDMLSAAEGFLLGFPSSSSSEDADGAEVVDQALTPRGHTIFTALLPRGCTHAWLEFVIAAHEHDDLALRHRAQEIVARIGERAAGWTSSHAAQAVQQQGGMVGGMVLPSLSPSPSASALVPVLSQALSGHLLRLPRVLPTASEAGQVALLKTLTGYITALGRASASPGSLATPGSSGNTLYDFLSSGGNMTRVFNILYRAFEVDARESRVLERGDNEGDTDGDAAPGEAGETRALTAKASDEGAAASKESSLLPLSGSDALSSSGSEPTYYTLSLSHLHSAAAHAQSLRLLRQLGRYTASHFGLLLGYLHERLLAGTEMLRGEPPVYGPETLVNETVFLVNTLVRGVGDAMRAGEVGPEIAPHVELLAMEYLSDTLWHLPLSNDAAMAAARARGMAPRALLQSELSRNISIVSLLVRGLGDMAQALQEEFRPMLMHVLYPLLGKLGNDNPVVRQAAGVTLLRIARATGYAEEDAQEGDAEGSSPADRALQRLLTDNMDYIVEQMSVELRLLRLGGQVGGGALTLPSVLSSLLTRVSLACTQAILPLLDDVLSGVVDTLAEMSVAEEIHAAVAGTDEASSSTGLGRLAYLDILRAVVRAIHLIQQKHDALSPPDLKVDSLYDSAPPLPLLPAASAMLLSGASSSSPAPHSSGLLTTGAGASLASTVSASSGGSSASSSSSPSSSTTTVAAPSDAGFDPDSLLNFDSDLLRTPAQSATVAEHPAQAAPIPTTKEKDEEKSAGVPSKPAESLPFFAPASIRVRLQASLNERARLRADTEFESEWLRRTQRAGGGAIVEEADSDDDSKAPADVPRDAEGKSAAERWFEEQQALRAKQAAAKYDEVTGAPLDDDAADEMEREANSRKAAEPPEVPLTPDQATALRIFAQCRHFLATAPGSGAARLAQQCAVLRIVGECVPVLERVPKHFFPELAKFWPSLVSALRLMDNARTAAATAPASLALKGIGEPAAGSGGGFTNSLREQQADAMRTLTNVQPAEANTGERQLTQLISLLSTSSSSPSGGAVSPSGGAASSFSHSTASPLFVSALGVLAALAGGGAARFLSGRFAELWPLLQHVLQFEGRWMAELMAQRRGMRSVKRRGGATQASPPTAAELEAEERALSLLPVYQVQLSLLRTLAHLSRFPDLSTPHVASLLRRTGGYLSVEAPAALRALAQQVYTSLAQVDPDATWTALLRLCPHAATERHEQRRAARQGGQKAATGAVTGTFLSHPCFAQAFPNFDARFLLHQRAQPIRPATPPVGTEYEGSVRALCQLLAFLPEPKLGL